MKFLIAKKSVRHGSTNFALHLCYNKKLRRKIMYFSEKNNKGIANEIAFTQKLDLRYVYELESSFKELLYGLFDNLKENDYIECWKSKYIEKADIKIRINGNIKGISIKMGEANSVHQEHIIDFAKYLTTIGVENDIIEELKSYIYGTIKGEVMSAQDYCKIKYKEIASIKKALTDFYVKNNLIMHFLFKGSNIYEADAIIHGTPEKFLWATKSEILKYQLKYPIDNSINIKVGSLNIQSKNRNLKNKDRYITASECIQVKWHSIERDLYRITKDRQKRQKCHIT